MQKMKGIEGPMLAFMALLSLELLLCALTYFDEQSAGETTTAAEIQIVIITREQLWQASDQYNHVSIYIFVGSWDISVSKTRLIRAGVRSCVSSPFSRCTPVLDWSE